MTENITEEQFKKFCNDFVENYEGRNFQELVKSLGGDWNVVYKGNTTSSLSFVDMRYGIGFGCFLVNRFDYIERLRVLGFRYFKTHDTSPLYPLIITQYDKVRYNNFKNLTKK